MSIAMAQPTSDREGKGVLNAVPAWGSYLYQNFVLPAFSPNIASEWLNLNSPFTMSSTNNNTSALGVAPTPDYFNQAWSSFNAEAPAAAPARAPTAGPPPVPTKSELELARIPNLGLSQVSPAGPSWTNIPPYYYGTSISTSLLMGQVNAVAGPSSRPGSSTISPSIDAIDSAISRGLAQSPTGTGSTLATPNMSPRPRGKKRRASSMDSEADHSHDDAEHDHEPEVPEGVERDGMIWGMKVDNYRALSARERKRVRNRISARTFRAKRKEHLSSLEHIIEDKDLKIKLATDEAVRLRRELVDLKKRLAKYEPA